MYILQIYIYIYIRMYQLPINRKAAVTGKELKRNCPSTCLTCFQYISISYEIVQSGNRHR